MAAAIDPCLLIDHSPWSQRAYTILDDMSSRGSRSANLIRQELNQLDDELSQLLTKDSIPMAVPTGTLPAPDTGPGGTESVDSVPTAAAGGYLGSDITERFGQNYELSPDQLMELANSLDLNSFTWPFPWIDDLPAASI
jgi:hypothetical protein